jgi:hypothetical protein
LKNDSVETFSAAWWATKVDRHSSSVLHFWVWFFQGVLIGVIGFISKGSHTALSILGCGVVMGLVAAIRCLAMYSDAAYGGTRKNVVVTNALIATAVFIFILCKFG